MMTRFSIQNIRAGRLTPAQVLRIRELYWQQNFTQRKLCAMFNVSIGTIGRIVRGESWRAFGGVGTHANATEQPAAQGLLDEALVRGAPAADSPEILASLAKVQALLDEDKPKEEPRDAQVQSDDPVR